MTIPPPRLCLSLSAGTPAVPGPSVPVACPGGQLEGELFPNRCLWAGFYPVLGKKIHFYPVRLPRLSPRFPRGRVPLPGGHTQAAQGPHGSVLALLPLGTPGWLEIPGTGSNPPLARCQPGLRRTHHSSSGRGCRVLGGSHRPLPLRLALARLRAGKGERDRLCPDGVSKKETVSLKPSPKPCHLQCD